MKRVDYISLVLFIICIVVLPCLSQASKVNVKQMNYSSSWRDYLREEAILEPLQQYPYEACFRKAAEKHDLPLTLLLALARGESDFNPKAQSSKSCYGIMQIQWPGTAKDLGFTSLHQLYDPCKNIEAGAHYLKKMLNRYSGDLHLAIAAYNYGPGRIPQGARIRSIPEGANWYSGYIYHHLQQVLIGSKSGEKVAKIIQKQEYKPGDKIPVILFHNPLRARNFLTYFKKSAPDIRLDWFRTALGETYVVLLADPALEKNKSIARMEKLGYSLTTQRAFR